MRQRANNIIVDLLQSNDFTNCMKKVKPSLKEDLISELSLILLETEPEKIVALHQNKQLTFYTVRIILTLAFSKTSPFYKKFRVEHAEFKDNGIIDEDDLSVREEREAKEDRALELINCLEWYKDEMIKVYIQEGTFRNMSKKTTIPITTCQMAVRNSFDVINGYTKIIEKRNKRVLNGLTALQNNGK